MTVCIIFFTLSPSGFFMTPKRSTRMSPNQHIVGGTFTAVVDEEIFTGRITGYSVVRGVIILTLENCCDSCGCDTERRQWRIGLDEIKTMELLSCSCISFDLKRDDPAIEPEEQWCIRLNTSLSHPIKQIRKFLLAT